MKRQNKTSVKTSWQLLDPAGVDLTQVCGGKKLKDRMVIMPEKQDETLPQLPETQKL